MMTNVQAYIDRIEGLLDAGARRPGPEQEELKEVVRQIRRELFPPTQEYTREEAQRRWRPFLELIEGRPNRRDILDALDWPVSGGGGAGILWG